LDEYDALSYQQVDSIHLLAILYRTEGGTPGLPVYSLTNAYMKTTLVTVQRKGVINIPAGIRTEVGIAQGDKLEASLQRGKIVLVPKVLTVSDRRTGKKAGAGIKHKTRKSAGQ